MFFPLSSIKIEGGLRAYKRSEAAIDALASIDRIYDRVIRPVLLNHQLRLFASGGSYGGQPWKGVEGEPKYKKYKMAIAGHLKPLILAKNLANARLMQSLINPTHRDHVYRSDREILIYGSKVPYSGTLNRTNQLNQFGERRPKRHPMQRRRGQITQMSKIFSREISALTHR